MNEKKKISITTAIFIGLVLGIAVGFIIPGRFEWILPAFNLVGNIYMNALKMMIFPMVFCSIILGVCSIGSMNTTGKIGGSAMIYFTCTTAIASGIGLVLPRIMNLGKGVKIEFTDSNVEASSFTSLLDTIQNIIPSNPIKAFADGNMLSVLAFAVCVAFACLSIKEKADPFIKLVESINEICMKIIMVVMKFTPLGVFCTIVPVVASNGVNTIISLGTVLIALYAAFFIFALIVYGGSAKCIGNIGVRNFFSSIMPAALNAFGTCSSSATIPISKTCAEEKMGVSNKITSLVIPLGATVNMDAVSILMSFMITFFANACNVNISIGMMITLLLCNVLLSIGTPGIPGGAIASFAALATIAGLPTGILGVYISVNTLCDMGATCVNVMGDLAGCVILNEKLNLED